MNGVNGTGTDVDNRPKGWLAGGRKHVVGMIKRKSTMMDKKKRWNSAAIFGLPLAVVAGRACGCELVVISATSSIAIALGRRDT